MFLITLNSSDSLTEPNDYTRHIAIVIHGLWFCFVLTPRVSDVTGGSLRALKLTHNIMYFYIVLVSVHLSFFMGVHMCVLKMDDTEGINRAMGEWVQFTKHKKQILIFSYQMTLFVGAAKCKNQRFSAFNVCARVRNTLSSSTIKSDFLFFLFICSSPFFPLISYILFKFLFLEFLSLLKDHIFRFLIYFIQFKECALWTQTRIDCSWFRYINIIKKKSV